MVGWINHSRKSQSLFAIALLLALSLRILSPAGFMPALGQNGLVLELCSQAGAKSISVDLGKTAPRPQQDKAESPCVFAFHSPSGDFAAPALVVWLAFHAPIAAIGTAVAHLTVHRLAAPPPPSQAPPSIR